jgi:serine/threonine-protein kinase RsbW
MKKDFELRQARLDDLERVHEFIDAACADLGTDDSVCFALRLAAEEVCTNIIRHGYAAQPGPITLTLDANAKRVAITIADRARPFSPNDAPPPDLDADWQSRQVGGLGWHLIRQMMDEIHYQPNPQGGNVLTLIKKLDK